MVINKKKVTEWTIIQAIWENCLDKGIVPLLCL